MLRTLLFSMLLTVPGAMCAQGVFDFVDDSPQSPAMAVLGSSGNVCQAFTISYSGGADDKPGTVTVTGLGTGNEAADLASVQLWFDADSSSSFDSQLDTLVDTQSYAVDNGDVTFSLASQADFVAPETRRFFVVYNLNMVAADSETFRCYVSAAAGSAHGASFTGLPAPSVNGTAGLVVNAAALTATLNGPSAVMLVNSNTWGPNGDGVLLCDVTLAAAPGGPWSVNSLTFQAGGTGDHDSAFSELALYQDDGSGVWDGAAIDQLAASAATGFAGDLVTLAPFDWSLPAATSRQFFLVGKMNGTAMTGQTFNARLESVNATPPAGGAIIGLPTAMSTALIIDVSALLVRNAPTQPSAIWHRAGTSDAYVVGAFRLESLNDVISMQGMSLTASGTGDFATEVDGVDGVQVWLDDGDGVFDAGTDTPLFQGAGAPVVHAQFSSPINMPVSDSRTLWVRVRLTDTAGLGASATARTFVLSLNSASDVSATSAVLIGTPLPMTAELGAIEFEVTSFDPLQDVTLGGSPITIQGSGFVAPFTVTIAGILCAGTPLIGAGGTQVTGLIVPPGSGGNVPIVIESGLLPEQTLAATFTWAEEIRISIGSTPVPNYGTIDIGDVLLSGKEFTFTIRNMSSVATLHLTGSPPVQIIRGANCSTLTAVVEQPAASIPTGGSTSATILVVPQAKGPFDLVVNIPDSYSGNINFTITGTGTTSLPSSGSDSSNESGCALRHVPLPAWLLLPAALAWFRRRRAVAR